MLLSLSPFKITVAKMFNYLNDYEQFPVSEPRHIPEIYPNVEGNLDFEELRRATDNFRVPAVVRGLFKDTVALKKWTQTGYLEQKFSNFSMVINHNGIAERKKNIDKMANIGETFKDILADRNDKKMLFFPKARDPRPIKDAVNNVTHTDLEVERKLWRGFGTESHKTYIQSSIIMANGFSQENGGKTSGTWWHCAIGNNWFVQVVGSKRWYFVSQKYSSYMKPGRKAPASMRSPLEILEHEDRIPVQYVSLQGGDLLYNPDWYWHRIENHHGLSIGVPLREKNFTNSFRNNMQFTSTTFLTLFLKKFVGYDFPVWGRETPDRKSVV